MENKIQLTFPCTQNWDGMQNLGNGKKHCATCNKCITNFTNHNTSDALNVINSEGGKTCGMFSIDQLDNIYQRHTLSSFKNLTLTLMGLLGIFATANTAVAQTTETVVPPVADADTLHTLNNLISPIQVTGRLRDKKTLDAAIYVKIVVMQNGTIIKATHTDFEGKFNFVLSKEELTDSLITIRVIYGFPEAASATSDYTVVNDGNLKAAEFDMLITGIPTHHLINSGNSRLIRNTEHQVWVVGAVMSKTSVENTSFNNLPSTPLENQLLQWNEQR